ncbi:MAG TPA: hypothetical protein VFB27_00610 [Opitutaceae bacterium]|nr:hypothetical protein [Opitutaceae bacterium]
MKPPSSAPLRSILFGGLAAGILDAIDALIAFKWVLGFDPIPIYQFVASGILGPKAFQGGLATAGLGLAIHFLIAFTAAAVFTYAYRRWHGIRRHAVVSGLVFGVCVYAFMNYVVIPLSAIPSSPFSLPLFLNGIIGHALFVGLPIALFSASIKPQPPAFSA